MIMYLTEAHVEIIVCDRCGMGTDGTRPNLSMLKKRDLTAEMFAEGCPEGTELDVTDYCPDCDRNRKPGRA